MIRVILDLPGQGRAQWPSRDADILERMEQYVHYESRLAPAEQLTSPSFELMRDTRNELRRLKSEANRLDGVREDERANFERAYEQVKYYGKQGISSLKAKYQDEFRRLEAWGLTVVEGERGWQVRTPRSVEDWLNFADEYTTKEGGFPSTERVPLPAFGDINGALIRAKNHLQLEEEAWQQRQAAVEDRVLLSQQALLYLKWAMISAVFERHEGRVTQHLEDAGHRIIWPDRSSDTELETGG